MAPLRPYFYALDIIHYVLLSGTCASDVCNDEMETIPRLGIIQIFDNRAKGKEPNETDQKKLAKLFANKYI